MNEKKNELQMSEAFLTSIFLAVSGGFQDAYTYNTREEVFSNAQTGNVVLMSQNFMVGRWMDGLRYLFPLLAFAFGVFFAERIQGRFKYAKRLHWRQGILLLEIVILFAVGFIPQEYNMAATVLVSFACAMQVQTFRKVNGYSYASTMCIGNLRYGGIFHVSAGQETGTVKTVALLFRNHSFLCDRGGHRRQSVHALRYSHDLGVGGMSSGQLLYDVF